MPHKILDAPNLSMTGDGNGFVTGYASVFTNFDSVGERVVRGAFAESIPAFLKDGFIAWSHDWSKPIGTPLEAVEDEFGLKVVGEFHSTQDAQEARTVIKERMDRGKSVKLSIGYEVLDDERTKEGRLLKKLRLYEWSYVTVPANQLAVVTDAKYLQRMTLDEHAQAVLATNAALSERWKSIADLLVKEGRPLSTARRGRIESQLQAIGTTREALAAIEADLLELLRETEPRPRVDEHPAIDPKALDEIFSQFKRITERYGVSTT